MTFIKRLREKHSGIIDKSAHYYELTYEKYGRKLTLCFMAPDKAGAKIKAKSIVNTIGAHKILDIRELDAKNLGPELTWNRNGSKFVFPTKGKKNERV